MIFNGSFVSDREFYVRRGGNAISRIFKSLADSRHGDVAEGGQTQMRWVHGKKLGRRTTDADHDGLQAGSSPYGTATSTSTSNTGILLLIISCCSDNITDCAVASFLSLHFACQHHLKVCQPYRP